jgi:hypothetical protein
VDAGRRNQRERPDARCVPYRDLESEPAADRAADDDRIAQIEALHEVEIEIGEVMDVVEPFGLVRAAEARMLGTSTSNSRASSSMNGWIAGAALAPWR